MNVRKTVTYVMIFALITALGGCRATVKDVDPNTDIRYTAEYGYSDLKKLSAEMRMVSRTLVSSSW